MSAASSSPFDFSQYVPGFDFLKNLTSAARPSPGLTGFSNWVAPTLNVEEVDKRLKELKAVQFWLEQNLHLLKATVQALEVQKMTLSALRGMDLQMGDLAQTLTGGGKKTSPDPEPSEDKPSADAGAGAGAVDPLQWWSALTQQFQTIAHQTMQDLAAQQEPKPESASGASAPARPARKKAQKTSAGASHRPRSKTPPSA